MRALMVGFDSFDPKIYERLSGEGKMPNLGRLAQQGGYSPLKVSNPPQTEVSWTSIATGADPGEHGIFDFVHRDPATYSPYVSILVTKRGPGGIQFVRPYNAHTIFDEAIEQGYPATVLWWPAMFPSSPESAIRVLPGLGTPDIKGQLGVGMFFSTSEKAKRANAKTRFSILEKSSRGYTGSLEGPFVKGKNGPEPAKLNFELEIVQESKLSLSTPEGKIELSLGKWGPIIPLKFKAGFMMTIHAITRPIVTSLEPLSIYFVPIQIHPLKTPWRYGTPGSFVKEVWDSSGPFLTLGWPQDTNGLEDDYITDDQFLALCEDIFVTREKILFEQFKKFKEGILASIFDDLDRIQHMFRRRNPKIVEEWYIRLDGFVGRILDWIEEDRRDPIHLLVLSDHGFADYKNQVHLNRWLIEHGYMAVLTGEKAFSLDAVDWTKTRAYAIGLNSLYLNLAGREAKGIVQLEEVETLTKQLRDELLSLKHENGQPVFSNIYFRHEAFNGPNLKYGPDLVIGYSPGFRASADTGLGKWGAFTIESNDGHWEADHCIDVNAVPGVIFSNKSLEDFPAPTFRDIPAMVVGKYFEHSGTNPPIISSGEDKKTMEERLKGLGYL